MSTGPLVSIVTPCLDPGERLVACLDSVASQTYARVEHLVVDGGSTDGTVELLRERGVRFVSEPDEGQAQAINKGFGLATGDWLGWLNADDLLTPRSVELAMAAAARSPSAGWLYGRCEIRRGSESSVFEPPAHVDRRTVQERNLFAQPGTLVARWALDQVGSLDEDLHLVMDFDLWLRLIDAGVPAVYVPEVLAIFEIHADSKTGTIPTREWELENAKAMLKRGHLSDGAALLGRTAARSAADAASRVERARLEEEIAGVIVYGGAVSELDVATLRAAAFAQAAECELFAPSRRYRYLLSPEPWRVAKTRRRLGSVLATAAVRFAVRRALRKSLRSARVTAREFLVRASAAAGFRLTRLSQHLEAAANGASRTDDSATDGRTLIGDRDIEWTWTIAHVRSRAGRILDFGSGNGLMALGALFAGNSVVAVDLEPERYPFDPWRIEYVRGDFNELELEPASFDQILNCSSIEHVGLAGRFGAPDDLDGDLRAMEKMARILKPDGNMILTAPVGIDGVYAPLHRVYGEERLPRLLEHWRIVEELYWAKPAAGERYEPVPREQALAETGSASYYALGLFVVTPQ